MNLLDAGLIAFGCACAGLALNYVLTPLEQRLRAGLVDGPTWAYAISAVVFIALRIVAMILFFVGAAVLIGVLGAGLWIVAGAIPPWTYIRVGLTLIGVGFVSRRTFSAAEDTALNRGQSKVAMALVRWVEFGEGLQGLGLTLTTIGLLAWLWAL